MLSFPKRSGGIMSLSETIIQLIIENIESDIEIKNDTDLRRDLDLDSFDVLMIMNAIDDEFAITLDEDDFKNVNTPQDIELLLSIKYGIK